MDSAKPTLKLKRVVLSLMAGLMLIIFSVVISAVAGAQHTTSVVGKVNELIERGDCRGVNQADFNSDLATLIQASVQPPGTRNLKKLQAIVNDMQTAAEKYKSCTNSIAKLTHPDPTKEGN